MQKYLVIECSHCGKTQKIPLNNNFNFIITEKVEENRVKNTKELYLQTFIENNFILQNNIKPKERILRSLFRKKYHDYLDSNNAYEYVMNSFEFNNFLKEKYGETYIKNDGIYYLRRLKPKD